MKTITAEISDELYARLQAIVIIAGTSINHIAEAGIEREVEDLEEFYEVAS